MESTSPTLTVRGIAVPIRLGCLPGERDTPQAVEFDVQIRFGSPPRAMTSDALADTISYADLVDRIKETVEGREFGLVEHLGHEVFTALRSWIDREHRVVVTTRKVSPPVPEIRRGAEFTLSG